MNKVKGKVILKGSGVGIPNILINVYNIDRQAMPTEILSRSGAETHPTLSLERLQGASRLGSVLTNRTGEFELAYEDSKFTSGNRENRPYILVLVTGPEEPGIQPCPPILHISCDIRQSAGRTETYLIQLSEEQLQKAGVPVPMTEPEEAEKIVETCRCRGKKVKN